MTNKLIAKKISMSSIIKNVSHKILSKAWATLVEISYDYKFKDGTWRRVSRESYNRGDGTGILLYNIDKQTIILTKQFRMPIYDVNEDEAMSIEVCAGAIDKNESAELTIIREVEEEVGYSIKQVEKVLEAYMSPGALTEKMHLYMAPYSDAMKVNSGGGLESENEEIEVMELPFFDAIKMMQSGEIRDAKTIMLLQYAQINQVFKK